MTVRRTTLEDHIDRLVQALRACASHLSIDAVAKYQVTGRVGPAEREFIHSLAAEPAMADGRSTAPQAATTPVEADRTPEDYVDDLIQTLRGCAAHLSIDAVARYQITGRAGQAGCALIRSLATEPAMADVQDGLYDHPSLASGGADVTYDAMVEAQAERWRASRGELPF